mgnify:FL=1|tara:strand:+ start:4865 stop:5380 length:516 start_codon:yes stop_codon:yes gene_type:complete
MNNLKRNLLKNLLFFLILLIPIGCSSISQNTQLSSKETIVIQDNFNIEGKFKLSNLDSKETGYFVISKTLNTVSLTLGKNYLLPEENFLFDIREQIDFGNLFDEIELGFELPRLNANELIQLFLGTKSSNIERKNLLINMDFENSKTSPSRIVIYEKDFELTLLVKEIWKN